MIALKSNEMLATNLTGFVSVEEEWDNKTDGLDNLENKQWKCNQIK